ncbi:hypothetical protein M0805_002168 [Coniferiporia weirii]|nr:hypothetical protein M0805_002168 [Coniferiporia weirii]
MQFLKVLYPLFLVFALLSVAFANSNPKPSQKPKPTPTPTPKPPSCSTELLCCLSLAEPVSLAVSVLLALLGIDLTSEQKGQECGLTCNPFASGPFIDECIGKPACCDKSYESGILAIGCKEVST